jgi:hypothetical protein
MPGVRETTLASSTAPETSTPATAISASQSQVAVDDTLVITQGDAVVKPGPVLPLPPEYPDMRECHPSRRTSQLTFNEFF